MLSNSIAHINVPVVASVNPLLSTRLNLVRLEVTTPGVATPADLAKDESCPKSESACWATRVSASVSAPAPRPAVPAYKMGRSGNDCPLIRSWYSFNVAVHLDPTEFAFWMTVALLRWTIRTRSSEETEKPRVWTVVRGAAAPVKEPLAVRQSLHRMLYTLPVIAPTSDCAAGESSTQYITASVSEICRTGAPPWPAIEEQTPSIKEDRYNLNRKLSREKAGTYLVGVVPDKAVQMKGRHTVIDPPAPGTICPWRAPVTLQPIMFWPILLCQLAFTFWVIKADASTLNCCMSLIVCPPVMHCRRLIIEYAPELPSKQQSSAGVAAPLLVTVILKYDWPKS